MNDLTKLNGKSIKLILCIAYERLSLRGNSRIVSVMILAAAHVFNKLDQVCSAITTSAVQRVCVLLRRRLLAKTPGHNTLHM